MNHDNDKINMNEIHFQKNTYKVIIIVITNIILY